MHLVSFVSVLVPRIAEASALGDLMYKINRAVINPLIILIFGIAVLMFVVGIVEYMANKDNADAAAKGKRHMLWGIIGMAIMVSVFGIMHVIINTLGITLPADATLPK